LKKPGAVSHDTRPSERADIPQHVTLRIVEGVSSLARDGLMKIIRRAIRRSHKHDFKIHEEATTRARSAAIAMPSRSCRCRLTMRTRSFHAAAASAPQSWVEVAHLQFDPSCRGSVGLQ
jgi:hypothetical protein